MKSIYMYHFTTFQSFLKIWKDKTLRFSSLKGLNDVNEVSKYYFGEHKSRGKFTYTQKLKKEVEKYKQISLIKESEELYPSCMLPVMWGHYGDKGKGICIKLDVSKIKFPNKVFRGNVIYDKITRVSYDGVSDITKFITENKKDLFFTKSKDWSYENEYRIVSKEEDCLEISKAITEIIITSLFGTRSNSENGGFRSNLFKQKLKPLIPHNIKLLEFCINGLIEGGSLSDEDNIQVFPAPININSCNVVLE